MYDSRRTGCSITKRGAKIAIEIIASTGLIRCHQMLIDSIFTQRLLKKKYQTSIKPSEEKGNNTDVQIRKNFNETAFFQPDLKTDAQGNVEISFTMPDALTRWKWMVLANTKDLAFGYSEKLSHDPEGIDGANQYAPFFPARAIRCCCRLNSLIFPLMNMSGTVQLEWLNPETIKMLIQ